MLKEHTALNLHLSITVSQLPTLCQLVSHSTNSNKSQSSWRPLIWRVIYINSITSSIFSQGLPRRSLVNQLLINLDTSLNAKYICWTWCRYVHSIDLPFSELKCLHLVSLVKLIFIQFLFVKLFKSTKFSLVFCSTSGFIFYLCWSCWMNSFLVYSSCPCYHKIYLRWKKGQHPCL